MRKLSTLFLVALGVLGVALPVRAETANWAAYAVATTQYSIPWGGGLPVFCFVGGDPAVCASLIEPAVINSFNGFVYGNFSAMQATGAPNTLPSCGDDIGTGTAWAPLLSGNDPGEVGQDPVAEPESLTLIYDPPVEGANRVDIYETKLGGFVTQVDVLVASGPPIVVFTGPDATPCPGILSIPFSSALPVVGVTVHTAKVGYEEIDAVAVVN